MKIGIIETGEPPPSLVPAFGTYVTMTRRLLGDQHDYETFRAMDRRLPQPEQCEGFIITGSACSAYDNLSWIGELEQFLRSARYRTRLVGICFGHQLMAQAFGGKVEKASQGWGLGLHRYEIRERAIWMDAADAIYATASHRDQVVSLPPQARVLGASQFTPCAILAYDRHPAISVQFHPEFDAAFSRALFAARTAPDLSKQTVCDAVDSMSNDNDNIRVGSWINRFLADDGH